ncbi:Cadherin EGF LAG seven-pass G-type receptor 3 [Amphibalanus amphitrite]|uniref:Cadherin EGF LAG seven-pass G-type receptor 3 n=1 Tax=Amphibalanus amphitrite TaxID=1232801 RepID=A0A6A4VP58_AMPAM|nr:Cadherin EGF LAG seven-pass G-type receptor 3 [Amphibalanus amphitrite]
MLNVRYPVTTDYYWGTIDHNTSVVPAGGGFDLGNGPFGFRSSITLPGDSCMRHASFMREGDTCVHDPSTCANGISFSLWHRCSFDSDAFTPREGLPYRYLISTGGDEASPGIAIYLQGMVLGALVSTGNKFWRVETIGLLPNNTWNNIGVRWRPPAQNGSEQEFTGLQLYINQQPAAMVIHGQTPNTTAQPPLDPPEFMVGCHKTSADTDYSHFCPCEFDEIALWKRALLTNETIFFIGGLEEDYAGMSAEVFADILRGVDLTDPDQQSVAVSIASKMVDNPEESIDNPLSSLKRPEQEEEDEEEEEEEEEEDEDAKAALRLATQGQISKMHVLADLLFTMTAPEVVKPNQTEQELNTFMNLVNLASQLLENKHHNKWKGIELQNNKKEREQKILKEEVQLDGESSDMIDRLEMYALSSVTSMVPKVVNGSLVDMFVHKPSANVDMYIEQRSVDSLRQEQMAPLPSDNPRRLDSIQSEAGGVPTVVFRKSGCEDALISTVFSTYDNYGDVTPKRFLRKEFKTKQAQYLDIDGAVLSLRLMATRNQQPTDECLPTIDDLRRSPVRTAHRHRQPKPALRGPLFHENEIVSDVFRRHCVWWNADALDGRGQWDATGCVVLETNDFFTKCACKVIGQYAVVAEKDEPKIVEIDSEWLKLFKDLLSAISIILLLLYAFIVWKNDSLWEMFHQIRMVTALLLVAGHCAMMESDRETVRQSRHSCTTAAAFIQFAYLAAGGMVASEGYACFRALAFGVVGGKLGSYVALSFGLSLVSLGYALGTEIHRYGDDPQCMMGWETDVKLIFLAPMALCLRKQIMAIDHASMCHGYVFFSPYFAVTWAAGVLAYLRLEALDDWPSFYPLFRVLNAATGLVFFVCQGLLSHRFLSMLLCRRRQRQQLLLAYARTRERARASGRGGEACSLRGRGRLLILVR